MPQPVEKRGTRSGRRRVFALKMEEICDTRRLMPSIHYDMRRLRKPFRYCIIPRRAVCPVPTSPFRSLPSSSFAFSLIIPKSSPFSELFNRMKKHRTLSGVFSASVQSFVCVPSQKGALSVCLHRQSSAGPLFTAVNGIPPAWVVPKWDWSQNG